MGNHIAMHGWKYFPAEVVTTQNTRKTWHGREEKTCLLSVAQQETKKKEHPRNNNRHQSRYSKLQPRAVMQA